MFYNEKHWKSNISFPPGGEGSSHPQMGSSSHLGVGGSLPPMVPIGSWEELWFPRVINRCSPTPPPALHLLHSAHHIDSIYNDSRQLEWALLESSSHLMWALKSSSPVVCSSPQIKSSAFFNYLFFFFSSQFMNIGEAFALVLQ